MKLAASVPFFTTPPPERVAAMIAAGPPPNLNAFLANARRYVDSPVALAEALSQYKPISGADPPSIDQMRLHVVLGNEASDMDSMVSSLVLAWYLSALYPPHSGNLFVPLMNLARSELILRSDVLFAFARVGLLDSTLLWCKDEVDWSALHRRASVVAILTDHNNLSAELEPPLAPFVVGVLDHHRDEGLYPLSQIAQNRLIVFPTGSCTSLLGEIMLRNAPWILSAEAFGPIDPSPAAVMPGPLAALVLLHSTLLMDTSNLSEKAGKKTKIDESVAQIYHKLIQDLTYQEMHRRRNDVSSLSSAQLLVKDTKYGESQTYPHFIASIPGSMQNWAKRDPKMLRNIEKFARERGVRFVVILTAYVDTSDHGESEKQEIDAVAERAKTLGQPSSVANIQAASAAASAASDSSTHSTDPMHGSSAHEAAASQNRAVPTAVGAAPASQGSSGTFKREITLLVLEHIPEGVAGSAGPHAPPGAKPVQDDRQLLQPGQGEIKAAGADSQKQAAATGAGAAGEVKPNDIDNPNTKDNTLLVLDEAGKAKNASASQSQVTQSFVERSPNVHVVGRPLAPQQLLDALVAAFEAEAAGPEKKLNAIRAEGILPEEILKGKHGLLVATLKQQNTKGSRKQVAPLVDALLSKL